jgi:hypothetical protein
MGGGGRVRDCGGVGEGWRGGGRGVGGRGRNGKEPMPNRRHREGAQSRQYASWSLTHHVHHTSNVSWGGGRGDGGVKEGGGERRTLCCRRNASGGSSTFSRSPSRFRRSVKYLNPATATGPYRTCAPALSQAPLGREQVHPPLPLPLPPTQRARTCTAAGTLRWPQCRPPPKWSSTERS